MSLDSQDEVAPQTNRFGHVLDPAVGYARGPILASSLEEAKRRSHAMFLIRQRAKNLGHGAFYNFTGLHRDFCVPGEKVAWGEEWLGPAFFWDELVRLAQEHFGGNAGHEVAVFNRCSAGIVSACLALAESGSSVLSVVPESRSHPSIGRGVRLAGAQLLQTNALPAVERYLTTHSVSLIVITAVSSELQILDQDLLLQVVALAKARGISVLLDDAYGTRLRPIIFGRLKTLETGVDVGVTACDKAGMGGPRAGLMVGDADLVARIAARSTELGLEARPPLALGVWASLVQFDPNHLRQEVELGKEIYQQLSERFGPERVIRSALGASISAEEVYKMVSSTSPEGRRLPVVPAEVTAGVGLYWLEHHGIISVNALGGPGASIWLRFKPAPVEVERFGGVPALIEAVEQGLEFVAQRAPSIPAMRQLILGP
jgi:L-seryl-tRNA(Ser) seleniumtransferase